MNKCLAYFCSRHQTNFDKSKKRLTNIPKDISRYEKHLLEINLQYNQISVLDKSIFRCKKLHRLYLNDNQIQEIPDDIGELLKLEELHVNRNNIHEISDSIKYCERLQFLDVSNNNLNQIPDGVTQLRNLQAFILNEVSLKELPSSISSLCNLQVLEARDNLLRDIPESISFLSKLTRLDLGCNEISTLPETIGQLECLTELWLDTNILSQLPPEIGDLKNLEILELSNNPLQFLPESLCNLEFLADLTLTSNPLTYLPENMGNLRELSILKVDFNQLKALPASICQLTKLTELYLSGNMLASLPEEFGMLRSLRSLHIDYNQIADLPNSICSCNELTIFSLRDNLIEKLPPDIGFLSKLAVLDLSGNRLKFLPLSVSKLRKIKAIWLSKTQQKSLYALQSEDDPKYGKVLTNFLLPQTASQKVLDNSSQDSLTFESPTDIKQPPASGKLMQKTSLDIVGSDQLVYVGKLQAPMPDVSLSHSVPIINIEHENDTQMNETLHQNRSKVSPSKSSNIEDFEVEAVSVFYSEKESPGIELKGIDETSTLFGLADSSILISNIEPNSSADLCDKLRVGDRVFEINGTSVALLSAEEAQSLINLKTNCVDLLVRHDPPEYCFKIISFTRCNSDRKLGFGVKMRTAGNNPNIPLLTVTQIDPDSAIGQNTCIKAGSAIVEANGITMLNKNGDYFKKLIQDEQNITLIVYNRDN